MLYPITFIFYLSYLCKGQRNGLSEDKAGAYVSCTTAITSLAKRALKLTLSL